VKNSILTNRNNLYEIYQASAAIKARLPKIFIAEPIKK
jgi:hypothetical protein